LAKKRKIERCGRKDTLGEDRGEFCPVEWIELRPKGLVFEGHHFVFILEDLQKTLTMPLRFPLSSADLIGLSNVQSIWKKSLTTLNENLFKSWNISLQRCVFYKQTEGRHRVKLFYAKDGENHYLEQDLENVLGLCMESKLPFYATRSYICESQVGTQKNENFILLNQKWTDARQKYLM